MVRRPESSADAVGKRQAREDLAGRLRREGRRALERWKRIRQGEERRWRLRQALRRLGMDRRGRGTYLKKNEQMVDMSS